MSRPVDPIKAPTPREIPLKDAPLVRVIAQLRFPEVLSIEQRDFVAPFQESIRSTYPVLRQEQTQGITLGAAGVAPGRPQIAWRFGDQGGHWRVSLTPGFLAIETTKYRSRSDFLGRLRTITQSLVEHVQPGQLDRLGIRYIDRVSGDLVDEIALLVQPEIRGIAGTAVASHATLSLSETRFDTPDFGLTARWGILPPETIYDPSAIEPSTEKSWVLDLDMFSVTPTFFVVDSIIEKAQHYAERIYTFFRWAVTDEFLHRYGGDP